MNLSQSNLSLSAHSQYSLASGPLGARAPCHVVAEHILTGWETPERSLRVPGKALPRDWWAAAPAGSPSPLRLPVCGMSGARFISSGRTTPFSTVFLGTMPAGAFLSSRGIRAAVLEAGDVTLCCQVTW